MVGSRPLSPSSCKCTYSVSNLGLSMLVKFFDPNKIGTENQRGIDKNIDILVDNVYEWIR